MRRLYANILLLVAALIWGVTFSFQQMAMAHVTPIVFTGVRFCLGALVVLPFAIWEVRKKRRVENWAWDWRVLPWLIVTGCALFLGALFQQIGIITTSVANAGFLTALYVPLTPILALLLLRLKPHLAIWPSVIACLGGAFLMSGGRFDHFNSGDFWVVGGAFFWAAHILLIGWTASRTGAPFLISCVQFCVCGLLGTTWGGLSEGFDTGGIFAAWPYIAFSGFLSVGIGFTLQVIGQRYAPPPDAAVILSGETVFAALAGMVLLGERLAMLDWFGGALILCGVLAVELLPLMTKRRLASIQPD